MIMPKVVYYKEDAVIKDSVLRYIKNRVKNNNKNFLCAFTGPTGSGKSYASLYAGEELCNQMNIHFGADRVVFDFSSLMELINDAENLPIGSVIVFDEPQVSINARTWQSQINMAFNSLVSTFRHRRLVVFFATPYLDFIDKATRVLFHAEFRMVGIDKENKLSRVKPDFIEYSPEKEDFYHHYLRVVQRVPGKKKMVSKKLRKWNLPLPSKELIEAYEKKKREFTDELNKKIKAKIDKADKKDVKKEVRKSFDVIKELWEKHGNNPLLIIEKTGYSPSTIDRSLKFLRNNPRTLITPS